MNSEKITLTYYLAELQQYLTGFPCTPSGTISKGQATNEICKTKPEPRSSKTRSSTLMKPTASHLAKQKYVKDVYSIFFS